MMKTQELKTQIEELTTQNDMMMNELKRVKKMLEKQSNQDGNSNELSNLADELYKIKSLADKLENKTSQYVSNQTQGNLNEKDVVDLVLILISGMVDWATEFIANNSSNSNQSQSQ